MLITNRDEGADKKKQIKKKSPTFFFLHRKYHKRIQNRTEGMKSKFPYFTYSLHTPLMIPFKFQKCLRSFPQ